MTLYTKTPIIKILYYSIILWIVWSKHYLVAGKHARNLKEETVYVECLKAKQKKQRKKEPKEEEEGKEPKEPKEEEEEKEDCLAVEHKKPKEDCLAVEHKEPLKEVPLKVNRVNVIIKVMNQVPKD